MKLIKDKVADLIEGAGQSIWPARRESALFRSSNNANGSESIERALEVMRDHIERKRLNRDERSQSLERIKPD